MENSRKKQWKNNISYKKLNQHILYIYLNCKKFNNLNI
jgi:hypothetical protein